VLVFVVIAVTRLLPSDDPRSTVAVPSLIGNKVGAAESTLRQVGLEPEVKNVHGKSGNSVGTVTGQDPAPNRQVAPASVVTLEVNVGPATVKIPKNLVGEQVKQAQATLEGAGFTNVRTRAVRDQTGKAAAGEVLSVNPKEGEPAALDETVELRYARAGGATNTPDPTTESSDTADPTKSATAEPTQGETSAADPSTSPPKTTEPTRSAEPTQSAEPTKTTKTNNKVKPVKTKPSKKAKPAK
jgi:beta-lactam-binding protein with PASTA domain